MIFYKITSSSYLELLSQKQFVSFPISTMKYINNKYRIISFQSYSQISGLPICVLTANYGLNDGFTILDLRPNLKLILYNDDIYNTRKSFTFIHEIGHLVLNHRTHGSQQEIESNFFASQFLAPNCILSEIRNRGYNITEQIIKETFGLSDDATKKKLKYLKQYPDIHKNENDDLIITKFLECLNLFFPNKNASNNYEWENMQIERDRWSY